MAQDMTLHDVDHMSNEAEGRSQAATVEGVPAAAFNRRLANLLQAQRARHDLAFRELARRSQGRFTPRDLKAAEASTLDIDDGTAVELAALYAVDLGEILGERLPVEIDDAGLVRTGGVVETFDPADGDSLLSAYLVLVRRLRRQQRADAVDLRRDDVLVLASHLGVPGTTVVERLGALMGATRARRTSMAVLFGAGVAVIGLTTGVAAVATSGGDGPTEVPPPVAPVVTTVVPETLAPPSEPVQVVVPITSAPRDDAHVAPNIVDTPAPVPTSVPDEVPEEPVVPVATNPPPATSPPATAAPTPTAPPPTAPPATDPPDQVGLPPVPPETSPPPVDTLPPGTPVVVDPPPPVVPPDDDVAG